VGLVVPSLSLFFTLGWRYSFRSVRALPHTSPIHLRSSQTAAGADGDELHPARAAFTCPEAAKGTSTRASGNASANLPTTDIVARFWFKDGILRKLAKPATPATLVRAPMTVRSQRGF